MRALFALAILISASNPELTQGDEIDCEDAMTQIEMNVCARRDYEAVDKELNVVWKDAQAAAKALDAEQYDDRLRGAEKALLDGQRGWIAYRDGQCDLDGFEVRGGTMAPMVVSGCLAEMTRARTKELKEFIAGP